MAVLLSDLEKRYDDGTLAVSRLTLSIEEGEFFTLLGPSGCGKTTLLRLIAGLEEPTAGSVLINGSDVTHVDPGDRDVAMVFQSYALYPHMTVFENFTLNLRVAGVSKEEARGRALETAGLLGIEALLDKKPGKLSGGERQRVALGRAIIRRPSLFLMDEPLSNLDLKLREQMRSELKQLHQRLGITTVYVTHDQAEALILSDRIAVMRKGEIQQIGAAIDVYEDPANLFVAEFIGSPGTNLIRVELSPGSVRINNQTQLRWTGKGTGAAILSVRPEDVLLVPADDGLLCGEIELIEPTGATVFALVRPEGVGERLISREHLIVGADVHRQLSVGGRFGLRFREDRVRLFDPESGAAMPAPAPVVAANSVGGQK